jgi:hypothetical protein
MPPSAALTAPQRNPKTGRFAPGNTASRLRALKMGARHLIGLDPSKCAPWARQFVELANADAKRLVGEHDCADDTALVRLCENVALANAVARALAVLGLQGEGNREALLESKQWFTEHRQELLSLRAEAREHRKERVANAVPTIDVEARLREIHRERAERAACERWMEIENFIADVSPRPGPGYTIERKDNDGDYEPGNWRWATQQEQAFNRRDNIVFEFQGESMCLGAWAKRLGVPWARLRERLKDGWSIERAFTAPLGG